MEANEAELTHSFFRWHPWIFAMIAPVIGIRSWSEESHCGVFEVLGTQPIRMIHLVFAKAFGAFIVIAASLLLTFPAVLTVCWLGNPDLGVILSGYLGSLLCGFAFAAVSQAVCAFMRVSIGSFVCSVALCLVLVLCGITQIANIILGTFPNLEWATQLLAAISISPKYEPFAEGRVELASVVGFLLLIVSSLAICLRALLIHRGNNSKGFFTKKAFAYGVPVWMAIGLYVLFALGGSFLPGRLDLTEGGRFGLPKPVIHELGALQREVTVRLFATTRHPNFGFNLVRYQRRIEEILAQVTKESHEKVKFERLDPNLDSHAAKIAAIDEVRSFTSDNGDPFMFGLVVESVGRKRVFDAIDPKRERHFIADLVQAILEVGRAQRKTIGVISPFAVTRTDPLMAKNWTGIQALRKGYDITYLDSKQDLGHPDIIILLHPTQNDPELSNKLETYLKQGGDLAVFVDPFSLMAETFADSGSLALRSSKMPDFIQKRGIKLIENRVVYDNLLRTDQGTERGKESNPAILTLSTAQLNPEHAITAGFDLVHFCYAGALEITPPVGYETVGLIRSSNQALLLGMDIALATNNTAKVDQAMGKIELLDSGYPLMVLQQNQQDEKEGRLLVASDVDWLYGAMAGGGEDENGKQEVFNSNIGLMQNIVDFFAGDRSLRELRLRSLTKRPLSRWDAIRQSIAEPFLSPLAKLSESINTLASSLDQMDQTRKLASNQTQRNAQAEHQIGELKNELRVRIAELTALRSKREAEIQMRLTVIKWFNVLTVPILAALVGLMVTFLRARKVRGTGA